MDLPDGSSQLDQRAIDLPITQPIDIRQLIADELSEARRQG
ncbi:hypothetical protein [Agromyces sp. H66]|nr:hypothetical protein [Agromyces sp. H66]